MQEGIGGTRPADAGGRVLYDLSRGLALAGGLVLALMAAVTAISVTGRSAFGAPIPGDFELIEIGMGVAVFAFLPYCQITRANVIVDFFLHGAPARVKAFFDTVGSLMYLGLVLLLLWRHSLGGFDMYGVAETTMILQLPRWWTFPVAAACLALLAAVCLYTLWRSIRDVRAGG